MRNKIIYYSILSLFVILLLTSYVYAQSTCVGIIGNSGQHSFTISGTVASVITSGNNTWLVMDTNTGPGIDLYNVKCGNRILSVCNEIKIALSVGSTPFVTVTGPIVLQNCPTALNHTVIFRGENIFY